MHISLKNVSKRYVYDYVLKRVSFDIESGRVLGISGANGSGKSTLLKIISAHLSKTSGEIIYKKQDQSISESDIYQHLNYAAPYIGTIDEFNLSELIDFHQKFKPFYQALNVKEFLHLLQVNYDPEKLLQNYSSGMQHRVKLGLAILSKSDLVILDEPSSFLDAEARQWFWDFLRKHRHDRTMIIASNDQEDFQLCDRVMSVEEWK